MQDKQAQLFSEEEIPCIATQAVSRDDAVQERKPRVRAINRSQLLLREVDVENLIGAEHEARAIWEFVGRLDLSRYYVNIEAYEGMPGSPAYDPQMLISLWVYSYAKGVSSAREVTRLCGHDPAYQWLTGMEKISYHTLSDFRVKHKEALDELFAQILGVLSADGIITLERVAHDGTKVAARAGSARFRREKRVQAHLEVAREQVKMMGDPRTAEEVGPKVAEARRRAARERCEKLELALRELEKIRATKPTAEEKKEARVSMTDPESRMMKNGADGGYRPSYNVQVSTDCAHGMIIGAAVAQSAADYGQLQAAEARIERLLGRPPQQMLVDGGYMTRANVIAMDEKGVDLYGPLDDGQRQSAGQIKRRGVAEEFRPERFTYDKAADTYQCPAGVMLRCKSKHILEGATTYDYRTKGNACAGCPHQQKCCPTAGKQGRTITRKEEDPRVLKFRDKMATDEARTIYKQRGAVAEFTNAWLKDKIGLRKFRLVGMLNVAKEVLWACIAYNIAQWIRIRWRPQMVTA